MCTHFQHIFMFMQHVKGNLASDDPLESWTFDFSAQQNVKSGCGHKETLNTVFLSDTQINLGNNN